MVFLHRYSCLLPVFLSYLLLCRVCLVPTDLRPSGGYLLLSVRAGRAEGKERGNQGTWYTDPM
jgi:hypothetical protein